MVFSGYDIISTGGVDKTIIENAEIDLGMKFSAEFREYLLDYGTVELNNNELFGLGVDNYCNVVKSTLDERAYSSAFPPEHCVIYNIGLNSVLVLLGNDGCVYEYSPKSLRKISDSFNQWVLEEFVDY